MAELLLELFSEEIPARMQQPMADNLRNVFDTKINERKLANSGVRAFATPRRITIAVEGLSLTSEDLTIEKRGPRTDAPQAAIDGFLNNNNIKISDLTKRNSDKGEFYFLVQERKGKPTKQAVKEIIDEVLPAITWPKSMRWARHEMKWVRPLKSVVAVFGGEILPIEFGHVKAGNLTEGHRFLNPSPFRVESFSQYKDELKKRKVILDAEDRKKLILERAEKMADEVSCNLQQDEGLLNEVCGLVEWPVLVRGKIDSEYMHLPEEVLISTIRANQKYLCMRDNLGKFAPYFIVVSNMETADGGKNIVSGNERVLRARLSDARFFWNQDLKIPLTQWAEKLNRIIFHPLLGNMSDKTTRIRDVANFLAVFVPRANLLDVDKAALLCKADLASGMVGEFPELQGIMGRYYAYENNEKEDVAEAIAQHYSPAGANDKCPTKPVSIAIALADKLDSLVGMFAIGERPTGSKDPFALRRSALGIIRIVLENKLNIPLKLAIEHTLKQYPSKIQKSHTKPAKLVEELYEFFMDRLKAQLKAADFRHDIVNAVLSSENIDDNFVNATDRIKALSDLLKNSDGVNLLAAYKRASNIVSIEEKKDKKKYDSQPSLGALKEEEEIALFNAISEIETPLVEAVNSADFERAMYILSEIREPIDKFFEKVIVNSENSDLRKHRLRLLASFKALVETIADFSLIEG